MEKDLGITILNDCQDLPLVINKTAWNSWASKRELCRGDVIFWIGDNSLTQNDTSPVSREEIKLIMWMMRPLELHILRGKYRVISTEILERARPQLEDDDLEFEAPNIPPWAYERVLHKAGYFEHFAWALSTRVVRSLTIKKEDVDSDEENKFWFWLKNMKAKKKKEQLKNLTSKFT